MKLQVIALLSAFTVSALAGGKGKAVIESVPPPPAPAGCQCFAAGTQGFSLYGASFSGADEFEDAGGAGLSYSYFTSENVGFEADATWGFTDSAVHTFNASLVLRAPIKDLCAAPYVMLGGGLHTNGVTQGTFHVGAGVDVRLTPSCLGIFADARYTFAEETGDYTVIRAGLRVNF